jgi:hypothetical protein
MTDTFYQERTYAFEVDTVGGTSMNDLIVEFMPVEPGWEFYSQQSGHPNLNVRMFGQKELVVLTYRKYGN